MSYIPFRFRRNIRLSYKVKKYHTENLVYSLTQEWSYLERRSSLVLMTWFWKLSMIWKKSMDKTPYMQ